MKYKLISLQIDEHPEQWQYISSITGNKPLLHNQLKFTIELESLTPYSKGDSDKLIEKLMTVLDTVEL